MLNPRHRGEREHGQVIVLFAMVLVVILIFAGLAVDLAMLRNDRQTLANTLDAAALAGGSQAPVDGDAAPTGSSPGSQWSVNQALIKQTVTANYPSLKFGTKAEYLAGSKDYYIEYKCLIGVDSSGQPYVSRDVPSICNPAGALGHAAVAADFTGAGATRVAPCDPTKSFNGHYDKCNVVLVKGIATTPYFLGPVVGINSGSTGALQSSACKGPCGQATSVPVDLVVIIDRTASMSDTDVTATKNAAKAVLSVYDPNLQRVALGLLGPSATSTTCSGPGGPAVSVNTYQGGSASPPSIGGTSTANVQSATNATGGATTLVISKPTSTASGNLLVAGITFASGTNTTISIPGWTLIQRTDNSTNVGMASFYKVAGAGEPATYTWTLSTIPASNIRASGGILRYTGFNIANPINKSGGGTGNATTSPFRVTAPSITTTTAETALVGFYGIGNGTTFTNAALNEQFDVRNANALGPSTEGATGTQTNAGATSGTNNYATASLGGQWVAQLIAINPVQVDTYGTNPPVDYPKWIPIGLTGNGAPAPGYNEAFQVGGVPNAATHIVSAINCFDHPGGTGTNLATPMAMATYYLKTYGRPNVKWGILLETDGQPSYSSTGDPTNYTCAQANTEATNAKNTKNANGDPIEVFTVGFGLDGSNDVNCPDGSGAFAGKKATYLLASMATQPSFDNLCTPLENTDGDHFFCEPKTTDLTSVFTNVATSFAGIGVHLVQLYPTPIVTSVAPATGPKSGGTSVTISGRYFTGATSVAFGGTPATTFTVTSDTTITATAPAGPANATVNVVVTTGGGVSIGSPTATADDYKYGP